MMNAIFPVLLEAAMRGLAAAVVIWAALRLFRVRNIRAQKAAWTLMLAGALAMPLLMRWQWLPAADAIPALRNVPRAVVSTLSPAISLVHAAVLPAERIAPAEVASPVDRAPVPPPFAWSVPSNPDGQVEAEDAEPADRTAIEMSDLQAPIPVPSESAPLPDHFAPARNAAAAPGSLRVFDFAWMIYLAVAAALLLRLIAGAFSALRLWRSADPILDSILAPIAADLAPGGILRSSRRISSPANVGSGIVLPADYGEWSDEKFRVVLAHEREHIRQRDFYLQLLAGLYAALTWFSPLGWWLKRKLSELSEAMSDRAGLDEAASPSSYAQMLLEFAALPQPLRSGVAMARAGRFASHPLASRIERLLNDATFRQAFTTGGRRTVLALVIAPLALLASAALVRVQAASQAPALPQTSAETSAPAQATVASQQTGVSNPLAQSPGDQNQQPAPSPVPPPNAAEPSPAPPAAQAPAPAPEPAAGAGEGSGDGVGQGAGTGMQPLPAAPSAPGQIPVPPVHVPVPPVPPIDVRIPPMPPMPDVDVNVGKAMMQMDAMGKNFYFFRNGRSFFAFDGGEPWALVPAQGEPMMNTRPLNGADRAEIDKARGTAHAPFFWFKHEGKSYIVDDPTLVAQVETLEKPIEDLHSQMRALGKQQRALGEQMRQKMHAEQRQPIPKPDLSKQMADLNAAVDSLKASQGDTVTREQLADIRRRVAQLQGQLAQAEGGFYKQNGQWGAEMGAFGKQMGQLGGEQGRLAGEMARTSIANRAKIDTIIKQSLSDGKAKPVN